MRRKKLGQVLVERGSVSHQDLAIALQEQEGRTILLGELLLMRVLVSKEDLVSALKEILHVDYVDSKAVEVDPEVVELIPHRIAEKNCAMPLFRENKKLVTAMVDPRNLQALDELRFTSGMEILPRLGFRDEISATIEKFYHGSPSAITSNLLEIEETAARDIELFAASSTEGDGKALEEFEAATHGKRTPAVRLVSAIIAAAFRNKASDIHIDPQRNGTVVCIRVDGILRDLLEIPQEVQVSLISRIKILGDMDIAERRMPQDGRILVRMGSRKIDLRVSTLPTQYGEKAVIRLLNPEAAKVDFIKLGLSQETSSSLAKILAQPQGMLLVTGPTGSGKTTTLYASLNLLRSRPLNIITVEDPVEYMLERVNQVQVNSKAKRTFPSCLRSILRQDPNVIMVGEIRDAETAEIALTAAQTGHLVLSTLHTTDSVGAIIRLLDLGVPPFLIASSVSAVIAQRLVRRLCSCCKEVALAPEYAALLLTTGFGDFGNNMYVPAGCPACQETGYKGRIGIYEILFIDEQTRASIRSGAGPDKIRRMARNSGMKLMQEEAIAKAKTGMTSLEEVFRVIPFESIPLAAHCETCKRDLAPAYLFCPHCGADRRAARAQDSSVSALESVAEGGVEA
jgi:type IV pilus assembly protein PilB